MLLRNGRLFLKKKNEASLLRDMVNQVKIVKQACRKEQAQHLQWSGRGLKVLFHATKIVFLTNSPKFWLSGNIWLVSFKISYLCLPLFYETRTTPSCHPSGCAYRQL